ncbi:leucine-rich repeat receptor-like serine/threonine-protein kinase [Pyrus ussuriensis x Pyrus communis]|uniref:Leucine-rich repeat receptor-like serine/threonine-protein kinase n=1 Tax=Pyrus ussuriensis x Pyrus communis TaxID=2448454 RepID=A0A5N5H8R3_9ROSA|nr:leucine-rich repeat receptor-like serine/threonine-protein kinase [Pyrus ussuriensis x Pyrus communis]
MTAVVFLFLSLSLFSFCSTSAASPPPYPYGGVAYHIDSGSPTDQTDPFNTTWLSDRFFTGGATSVVSEPLQFHHPQEKTLRYFPLSSGKKNCYIIPNLPSGRYYIRTFTVYDNYDGKSHSPSFDVSVEGTVVFSWRSPWSEDLARNGAYSDLFAFVADSEADICFYSIATDPPVIGSLQLIRVDPDSYDAGSIGKNYIIVNYGRLTCGSDQFGPGFSNDTDLFGRSWQNDKDFRFTDAVSESAVRYVSTRNTIANTDQSPNYFPMKLYQSATVVDGKALEYELPVDAKLDYLLWFHFAEIDSSVKKAGQRVFDILINGKNVNRIDIFKEVGSFAAYSWHYTVKNLSSSVLNVKLQSVAGATLISGLENYALVPADVATVPEQVVAMRALKESLRVPDRMGWNGDPCAPSNWDAWEGVSCQHDKNGTVLIISGIDLGSQGLKGFISDQISLLSNLVSLNLSSNSLEGVLPSGLGQKSLKRLDLSNNEFTGPIPQSLTTSNLQLLLLNNNLLEGKVPEELYSIGVHGGAIDLYGNKGLCGVPSLPDCPLFWENGGLSKKGKIAIAVSCVLVFCLVVLALYIFCIRRRRNDYDFSLPQDLMALSAKRNRYQRQKSLMLLEMESQHAKASTPLTLQ